LNYFNEREKARACFRIRYRHLRLKPLQPAQVEPGLRKLRLHPTPGPGAFALISKA